MTQTTEVTVEEAWDRYARNKRSDPDYSDGTVRTYRSGVDKFVAWMEEENHKLGGLDAWDVGDFTTWMEDNYDLQANTVASYTKGVQQLLKYCAEKELIKEKVADGHETRTASKEEKQWDKEIDVQRAEDIASYLQEHYPGRRDTVIFTVLLRTGMRMSGLRAIDLGDIYENGGGGWVINLRDREDTSLKDSDEHERVVNIRQDTWELIKDYVNNHRKDVTVNGRKPLITTRHGRASPSTVRTAVYKATCPNRTGVGECDCEPPVSKAKARKCDESHSPHALRAAHVTHARDRDVSWEDVSGRVACQPDTLRLHYDRAGKEQEAERRRSLLDEL
jgi:site-specific recombinase XerD